MLFLRFLAVIGTAVGKGITTHLGRLTPMVGDSESIITESYTCLALERGPDGFAVGGLA